MSGKVTISMVESSSSLSVTLWNLCSDWPAYLLSNAGQLTECCTWELTSNEDHAIGC